MKITRTITKARYSVLVYDKSTKAMTEKDYFDTENIKPEFLEKAINRNLPDNQRLCEFEQIERQSFKLTMSLVWGDSDMPTVTVDSLEPIENVAYNE